MCRVRHKHLLHVALQLDQRHLLKEGWAERCLCTWSDLFVLEKGSFDDNEKEMRFPSKFREYRKIKEKRNLKM